MKLRIWWEKCLNFLFYCILFYIGRWSELEILSWLVRRRGWAWMFPNELYLADPTIAHEILTHYSSSHFNKAPIDDHSPLSASMLNDPHQKPYARHALIQRLSSKQIWNSYVHSIEECTERLINQWKSNGSVMNITDACTRLALDIIGQTLLDGTFDACAQTNIGNDVTRCMLKITREQFTGNKFSGEKKCIETNDEMKLIENLLHKRWINSEQILDFNNTKLILFAGSETSATTLALTLFTLAHRQDIQTKLREQLIDQSIDQIKHNSFLDSFIREILRFWCIAPFITRRSTGDLSFQTKTGRTLFIPSASDINIFTWAIHRSSNNCDRGNQFDINRIASNKYCYLPFSTGSRMCPGMEFAIAELKVVVTILLLSIEFEPMIAATSFTDVNKFFEKQLFHIDWHHAVLHTQQQIYLKIRFLDKQ